MPAFDRPVFIVAAPRSGSTWLFELLARHPSFWTLGGEGHGQIESIAALHPANRGYDSNRLTRDDAAALIALQLKGNYAASLVDVDHRSYRAAGAGPKPAALRFLEKTPKNALRIPFLKAIFPDAKFIFLHREPRSNLGSIMAAWRSGSFVTYAELPGWQGVPWSLLLIPGWRSLIGSDLARIALEQWRSANDTILADLRALPESDWCALRYEDLVAEPAAALERLCAFAGVPGAGPWPALACAPLRPSRHTLTPPAADKWRQDEASILAVIPDALATAARLHALDPGNSR